ncbi:AMP-binding protein [Sphingomonas lacunae]|uniref:AMP-binding protein n=1 Tax=Sphingomonas lacunae TaxID=2698828 RepID=A0A6M4AQV3_9SPHN|nr:AMP-binding protein [Sphingomonas lacunae]QJQ31415.1 AMP-binding protein [Sphingomonas lacunae]
MTLQTFSAAFAAATSQTPDSHFTVYSEVRPSQTQLADIHAAGQRLGSRMIEAGIAPGDRIAVMLPNWREWLVCAVACAHAGAVILPVVTIYGAKELGFILRQSGARWLFTPEQWRGVDYAAVVADCGDLPALDRHVCLGEAFDRLEADGPVLPAVPAAPDDLAMLVYTSGTTADPKGVKHSHRSLLAELAVQQAARGHVQNEVVLSPWPPGHVAGALSMLRFLVHGVPIVAMDQWDATAAARLIEEHRVTSSSGTPFHLSGIIEAAERDGRDVGSLINYLVGAAPVPSTLVERSLARGIAVYHCYGSSEHPTVTSGTVDDPLDKQLHTEGRVMAGSELRFVDDDGRDVPPGEEGEIATRGPELFVGYYDEALNAAAFLPGGWYRTGDIGRLDAEGYLLITDRKKDIIIRGGENISSKEVEELLLDLPQVAEVAVVAAKHERMGEVVHAVIVARPGQTLTLDAIRAHFAAAGIARQKTPEKLTLVDALPRNATGKILKHLLRNNAA